MTATDILAHRIDRSFSEVASRAGDAAAIPLLLALHAASWIKKHPAHGRLFEHLDSGMLASRMIERTVAHLDVTREAVTATLREAVAKADPRAARAIAANPDVPLADDSWNAWLLQNADAVAEGFERALERALLELAGQRREREQADRIAGMATRPEPSTILLAGDE